MDKITVKNLRRLLETAPDDAIVVIDNHGDLRPIEDGDVRVLPDIECTLETSEGEEEYTGPVVRISSWA